MLQLVIYCQTVYLVMLLVLLGAGQAQRAKTPGCGLVPGDGRLSAALVVAAYAVGIVAAQRGAYLTAFGVFHCLFLLRLMWTGIIKHAAVYLTYKADIRRSRKKMRQSGVGDDIALPRGYSGLGGLMITLLFNCLGIFASGFATVWFMRHLS
jgi:hypothetical protein